MAALTFRFSKSLFSLAAAALVGIASSSSGETLHASVASEARVISPASHRDLLALFRAEDYDWSTLDKGVPPIVLTTLPADLARIPQITERKRIFFLSLLPMVLMVNDEILTRREEALAIFEAFDAGYPQEEEAQSFIAALAAEYAVESDPLNDPVAREALLRRVDIIPASLVLAQAANESAYGTSRFALRGNNLFGEWTFSSGSGMVPLDRPKGETYEVAKFPTLYDSVKSYMKNINTHWAYLPFRNQRATQRAAGLPLQGRDLAQGLEKYSVRGEAYVGELRSIIRRNRLSLLSSVTLRQEKSPSEELRPGQGLLSTGPWASRRMQKQSTPRDSSP